MNKIRKGDEVIIITGKHKGQRGVVSQMLFDTDKVVVEGINKVKKHVRPNPMANVVGGIVDKEMPIHISNVAIYNPSTGKADRVGIKIDGDKKSRVFKSNGQAVAAK
jgi:large subunit ribosomal protein L24